MKKLVTLLMVFTVIACNNQKKEGEQVSSDQLEKDTTIVKPIEKWDVKKEYDEFGNLIRYDSIYSWSYTNTKGDSIQVNLDSIMDSFKGYLGETTPRKWEDDFFYFPKNDSMFMKDFFKNDYFFRNWQSKHSEIEEMIRKMDAERNAFLKRFHPGLMESNDKN
jgi:hypothetical protein